MNLKMVIQPKLSGMCEGTMRTPKPARGGTGSNQLALLQASMFRGVLSDIQVTVQTNKFMLDILEPMKGDEVTF